MTPDIDTAINNHVRAFAARYKCTPRETDLFVQLASGVCSHEALCEKLKIKNNTVSNHLKGLFQRMQVESKTALVACVYADLMKEREATRSPARGFGR